MATAFDGSIVPDRLKSMNCGGIPIFDVYSGMSYICDKCLAVIGSLSQSEYCKEINQIPE